MSVGATMGASATKLVGKAKNLQAPGDLAGSYSTIGASGAVAGGVWAVRLREGKALDDAVGPKLLDILRGVQARVVSHLASRVPIETDAAYLKQMIEFCSMLEDMAVKHLNRRAEEMQKRSPVRLQDWRNQSPV